MYGTGNFRGVQFYNQLASTKIMTMKINVKRWPILENWTLEIFH